MGSFHREDLRMIQSSRLCQGKLGSFTGGEAEDSGLDQNKEGRLRTDTGDGSQASSPSYPHIPQASSPVLPTHASSRSGGARQADVDAVC